MCNFHKQMNATNSTVDTMWILARKRQDFHLSHKQHQEQNFPETVNRNRTMWAENHTIKHWKKKKKKKPPVSDAPETPTRRWCSCTSRSRPESVSPSQQRERERERENVNCVIFFSSRMEVNLWGMFVRCTEWGIGRQIDTHICIRRGERRREW